MMSSLAGYTLAFRSQAARNSSTLTLLAYNAFILCLSAAAAQYSCLLAQASAAAIVALPFSFLYSDQRFMSVSE
jgi:hypothetical protein